MLAVPMLGFSRQSECKQTRPSPGTIERQSRKGTKKRDQIVQTCSFRDELGQLLFPTCRTDANDCFQRRPGGEGGWIENLDGVCRDFYRLPKLVATPDRSAVIVEEDKDVKIARKKLGRLGTCNPLGRASGTLSSLSSFTAARSS
jgi:hypothetical protein